MDGRRAYFWLVPANVMGGWNLDAGAQKPEIALEQTFQKISGTVDARRRSTPACATRACAAPPSASPTSTRPALRRDFTGRVTGGKMEGTFRDEKGAEGKWSATKK